MIRATRLPLALALGGVLTLGLAGCDSLGERLGGSTPRTYAAPPAQLGTSPAGPSPAVAPAAAPRPGAVVAPNQPYAAPRPEGLPRDNAQLLVACRRAADEVIARRDRAALIREDERDSRLGTEATIASLRAPIDRLGRQFERDRIAQDCVQQNAH